MAEIDDLQRKISRHDREYFSYTRCNDKIAKRVNICQAENESIKVEIDPAGSEFVFYDEAPSVVGLGTATILSYTVPVGKKLTLVYSNFSGDNRGIYSAEINSVVVDKKRTYYVDYNGYFKFSNLKLLAGDNIKIMVENQSSYTGDFNANIQGSIRDA